MTIRRSWTTVRRCATGCRRRLHRALDRLLRKCLAKDPDERWQSAADLGAELRWIQHELLVSAGRVDDAAGADHRTVRSRSRSAVVDGDRCSRAYWRWRRGAWWFSRPVAPTEVVELRYSRGPVDTRRPLRRRCRAAARSRPTAGISSLRVGAPSVPAHGWRFGRSTRPRLRHLPGTEGATHPFWSPDSAVGGVRCRAQGAKPAAQDRSKHRPRVAPSAEQGRGRGAWGKAGFILLGSDKGHLERPCREAASPTLVTKVDRATREKRGHLWPVFLLTGDASSIWRGTGRALRDEERRQARISRRQHTTARHSRRSTRASSSRLGICCSTAQGNRLRAAVRHAAPVGLTRRGRGRY